MSKIAKTTLLAAATLAVALPLAANADWRGDHPAYVHALSDLQEARWNLAHRGGDSATDRDVSDAIAEIDSAIDAARHAASAVGKDVDNHVAPDVQDSDWHGRLHNAETLLRKAESDVDQHEDDSVAREDRDRVMRHIDAALHDTDRAIDDADRHN